MSMIFFLFSFFFRFFFPSPSPHFFFCDKTQWKAGPGCCVLERVPPVPHRDTHPPSQKCHLPFWYMSYLKQSQPRVNTHRGLAPTGFHANQIHGLFRLPPPLFDISASNFTGQLSARLHVRYDRYIWYSSLYNRS